ncbi:MAG: YcxB family protein [Clostridia bacterium]|nr:YcxB family protein [Clostridia bacterium]MBO5126273.1 YcxB family protein [Clostridia bacterium]MBO5257400.1 YcxB family protein [Clostridia bacterium]
MEFVFETAYDAKATTAMAKVLRKTVRRKHSRRSHIFGWIVVILSLLLTLPLDGEPFVFEFRMLVTWVVTLMILIVFFCEDRLNGAVARKNMIGGAGKVQCTFTEEHYVSVAEIGTTEWHYGKIEGIAETGDYFVFVFGKNHAQVYDKRSLTGGTEEDFRTFLTEKTGKTIQNIK